MGWGVYIKFGNNISGIWFKLELFGYINYLELLVVKFVLFFLFDVRNNIYVWVMFDNNIVVFYINFMGGCRFLECNFVVKDIWDWVIDKDIWLLVVYIFGLSNIDVDQLFWNLNLDLEWMFFVLIFQRIVVLFGKLDIDLFVSRFNVQVKDYVFWKLYLMVKFVDVFIIDWL